VISETCQRAVTPEAHKLCPVLVNEDICQCSCHPGTANNDIEKEGAEQIKVQSERAAEPSEVGSYV
jgi:hypothetical protein